MLKNNGVQKTLEEFKVSRATIYRWIKSLMVQINHF